MNKNDQLDSIIDLLNHNINSLTFEEVTDKEAIKQLLENLQIFIEELRVADEELIQQTEELVQTRSIAEREHLRYQNLFNFASDGYLITDLKGKILEANLAVSEMFGIPSPFLNDTLLIRFVPLDYRAYFRSQLNLILKQVRDASQGGSPPGKHTRHSPEQWEIILKGRNHEFFTAVITVEIVTNEPGSPLLWWSIKDITDIRKAKKALQEQEKVFRTLTETSSAAIFLCQEWQIQYANPSAVQMMGFPLTELLGQNLLALIHPDFQEGFLSAFNRPSLPWQENNAPPPLSQASYKLVIPAKNHQERWVSATLSDTDLGGEPVRIITFHDVTQTKVAERERMELLRRLFGIQEEERQRISRELHDQMGQTITALTLGLKSLESYLPDASPGAPIIKQLQELANQLGREAHQVALELRPTSLDDLGLQTSLSNLLEDWAERNSMQADFEALNVDEQFLPPEITIVIYRIFQEALNNILKHAGASRVGVLLDQRPTELRVFIEDNGCGFSAEEVVQGSPGEIHLGLSGMKERAAQVGGAVTIETEKGRGTTVYVQIPLSQPGTGDGKNKNISS